MITPRLETERLILRHVRPADTEAICRCWMQDEDVSRYMWWKASNDRNEAKKFVEFELGNIKNEKWNRWIILLKNTEIIIGTCLIFYNEEHWDISYNLGKQFWGKGYVMEAMSKVISFVAESMKVQDISTTYAKENLVSGRVLEKLGFRYVKDVPYSSSGGEIKTTGHLCQWKISKKK